MDPDLTKPPDGHTISWAPKHQAEMDVHLPETGAETPAERFRIGAELARGGMGIVYRAHDMVLARDVAVKIMQGWAAAKGELVSRFWEESRITAQLQHPGIPPVYEAGVTDDGAPYLAMKLIKGETLATLLAARTDLTHERSRWLGVIEQICQAVAYAHQHQVIHRDLKPQNVMVGAFGEVQVMDWGLAKVLRQAPFNEQDRHAETLIRGRESNEAGETQVGDTVGTPAYMSPEQARGENDKLDPRTDVFSLGAMLCVVLIGVPPYAGKRITEILEKARAGDVREALEKLNAAQLDPELVSLVTRCLSANPVDRLAHAGDIAEQLAKLRLQTEERLRAAEVETARTQVRIGEERKRRRVQLGLAGAVILLLLGGVVGGSIYQRMIAERKQLEIKQQAEIAQQEAERKQLEEKQRAETLLQETQVRASAEAAITQAHDLVQRSLWPEATVALLQARRLLRDTSDPETKESIDESLADVKLLAALDEINLSRFDAIEFGNANFFNNGNTTARYEAAFKSRGWNVFDGVKSPAAQRIAQSPAKNQFIEAIDAWALGEPNPVRRLQILLAADQLTGQTWRSEFAVNWFLPTRLEGMLQTVPAEQQTPGFLGSVGRRMEDTGGNGLAVLRSGCRIHPHSFFIHMRLADHLEQSNKGSKDEAIGTYRAAVAIRPQCATAWIALGKSLLKKDFQSPENVAEAVACLEEAVRVQPQHAPARAFLAMTYAQSKNYPAAEAACQKSLEIQPSNPLAYRLLFLIYGEMNRDDDALAAGRRAIELSPPDAVLQLGLAELLLKRNDLPGATVALRRAVEIDPKNSAAQFRLGLLLQDAKDPGAIAALRETVKLEPKKIQAWHNLRKALEDSKDMPGALAAQQQIVALEPNDAGHHERLANLLLQLKQLEPATAALEAAAKLQPQNYDLQFRVAGLLADQGKAPQALEYFRRSVALQPDSEWAVGNLVAGLGSQGKGEEALQIARQTAERLPDKPWAQNSVGFALLALGRRKEAKEQFEKVIALDPKFAGPYNDLGSMALSEGRYEEACAMYEKVLALHPGGFSFARPHLGLAWQRRGDLKKAEEHLAIAASQSRMPWIAAELARTRGWIELEPRVAKLRTGEEEFRDVEDAAQALDYCRQPFCQDRLLMVAVCEWLVSRDLGAKLGGDHLRLEGARAAIQQADSLPPEDRPPLRNKGLRFLRSYLQIAARAKEPAEREFIRKVLLTWQNEPVVANFRAGNDKLPEAEQKGWKSAWDDLQKELERLPAK